MNNKEVTACIFQSRKRGGPASKVPRADEPRLLQKVSLPLHFHKSKHVGTRTLTSLTILFITTSPIPGIKSCKNICTMFKISLKHTFMEWGTEIECRLFSFVWSPCSDMKRRASTRTLCVTSETLCCGSSRKSRIMTLWATDDFISSDCIVENSLPPPHPHNIRVRFTALITAPRSRSDCFQLR